MQGELRRAERFLKLALDEAKQGFGLDDPHVAAATQNLAELYRVSRQYDLAGPLYEQVGAPILSNMRPIDRHVHVRHIPCMLTSFVLETQALESLRSTFGELDVRTAAALHNAAGDNLHMVLAKCCHGPGKQRRQCWTCAGVGCIRSYGAYDKARGENSMQCLLKLGSTLNPLTG